MAMAMGPSVRWGSFKFFPPVGTRLRHVRNQVQVSGSFLLIPTPVMFVVRLQYIPKTSSHHQAAYVIEPVSSHIFPFKEPCDGPYSRYFHHKNNSY